MGSGYNKEELIGALASAMGQGDFTKTKYDEAKYDPSTGTLYCNGYIISRSTVDAALSFFKEAKMKADKHADDSPSLRNVALFYQTAIEAIIMMKKSTVATGGKIIAKN